MKYLAIGDVHISSSNRLDDRIAVLNQIVDIAIERKVDKTLWLGDIFDSRHPNPQETGVLYDIVQRLIDNNIEVVLLIGNHDESKGYTTLDVFEKLKVKGVKVVTSNHIEDGIYLGHFLVSELVLNSGFILPNVITADQLITRFPEPTLYLLGDNHKPSEFSVGDKTLYSLGSVDRNNFGERQNEPRVLLINSCEQDSATSVISILLKVRPMIQINWELTEHSYEILGLPLENKIKNSIVKLIIRGTEEDLKKVDMTIVRENLKTAYSLTIQYDVVRKELVRDLTITEDMSDEKVLERYLITKREDLTNQEKEIIFDIGKEIIQQTKERR